MQRKQEKNLLAQEQPLPFQNITDLGKVGTRDAATGILNLFRAGDERNNAALYFQGTALVCHAIETLEKMESGLAKIAMLTNFEQELSPSWQTHEDLCIATILERMEQDPREATAALGLFTGDLRYKALRALQGADAANVPYVIARLSNVDFSEGLTALNVTGLEAMSVLHDKVKAGEFRNVNPGCVRLWTRDMVLTLLDVPSLLATIKPGSSESLSLVWQTSAALKAIDERKIIQPENIASVFSRIVGAEQPIIDSKRQLMGQVPELYIGHPIHL